MKMLQIFQISTILYLRNLKNKINLQLQRIMEIFLYGVIKLDLKKLQKQIATQNEIQPVAQDKQEKDNTIIRDPIPSIAKTIKEPVD